MAHLTFVLPFKARKNRGGINPITREITLGDYHTLPSKYPESERKQLVTFSENKFTLLGRSEVKFLVIFGVSCRLTSFQQTKAHRIQTVRTGPISGIKQLPEKPFPGLKPLTGSPSLMWICEINGSLISFLHGFACYAASYASLYAALRTSKVSP